MRSFWWGNEAHNGDYGVREYAEARVALHCNLSLGTVRLSLPQQHIPFPGFSSLWAGVAHGEGHSMHSGLTL